MDNNEISMILDTKFDIHDKRSNVLKYKVWSRCLVKIEAIQCLPCFLRVTFQKCDSGSETQFDEQTTLIVSIIVPGVVVSLASSRTKQYSYGLFWAKHRRDCFIYFGFETEANCRRHMKWIKKSIKNLELYRQVFLEQRRKSKGPVRMRLLKEDEEENTIQPYEPSALGPLPKTPDTFDGNRSSWSRRISRASAIYEEIFETTQFSDSPRLSRRLSTTSIASGIYEEMKPVSNNFNVVLENVLESPPPLPPLPPPRKRVNTFETETANLLWEIPRSNTNPESELAKKKKYRNVLENIFGNPRSKRAESVSESQACLVEDILRSTTPRQSEKTTTNASYSSEVIAPKRKKKSQKWRATHISQTKRNSFSSPDLSKINFLDTDEQVADVPLDDFDLSSRSLDESVIVPTKHIEKEKSGDLSEKPKLNMNISQKIPSNFNFSACNSSKINLIGANGATSLLSSQTQKIIVDDLTGYCVMAPIMNKMNDNMCLRPAVKTGSSSSDYSTISHCSPVSCCTDFTEQHLNQPLAPREVATLESNKPSVEEGTIYENMMGSPNSTVSTAGNATNSISKDNSTPRTAIDISDNLYENLFAGKTTQEVEKPLPGMSTSTPTDSPLIQTDSIVPVEDESYYQTPRKSIISVDEKIPSYYPNSCDTAKMRRGCHSPAQLASPYGAREKSHTTAGVRHLASLRKRLDRKENLYITSPPQLMEQRHNTASSCASSSKHTFHKSTTTLLKIKKTAAHKISESVYAVTHANKKCSPNSNSNKNNNTQTAGFTDEMKAKLQTELLQLAVLQKIDFKFDDASVYETDTQNLQMPTPTKDVPGLTSPLAKSPAQHHLRLNQYLNTNHCSPSAGAASAASSATKVEAQSTTSTEMQLSGVRKFASLPRFRKFDLSPLKLKINNVLQRHHHHDL